MQCPSSHAYAAPDGGTGRFPSVLQKLPLAGHGQDGLRATIQFRFPIAASDKLLHDDSAGSYSTSGVRADSCQRCRKCHSKNDTRKKKQKPSTVAATTSAKR